MPVSKLKTTFLASFDRNDASYIENLHPVQQTDSRPNRYEFRNLSNGSLWRNRNCRFRSHYFDMKLRDWTTKFSRQSQFILKFCDNCVVFSHRNITKQFFCDNLTQYNLWSRVWPTIVSIIQLLDHRIKQNKKRTLKTNNLSNRLYSFIQFSIR